MRYWARSGAAIKHHIISSLFYFGPSFAFFFLHKFYSIASDSTGCTRIFRAILLLLRRGLVALGDRTHRCAASFFFHFSLAGAALGVRGVNLNSAGEMGKCRHHSRFYAHVVCGEVSRGRKRPLLAQRLISRAAAIFSNYITFA